MPAIHRVFQVCPDDEIVLEFSDGSIYLYPSFRVPVETVLASIIIGRRYNQPGFRRPKYPRPTGPYERLDAIPDDALLIYEEPPYRATAEPPTCPTNPAVLYWPVEMQAWATDNYACALTEFTQDDPDNYTGGTCIGPAFLSNAGPYWILSANVTAGDMTWHSSGTASIGPYTLVSPFFGVYPPDPFTFVDSPP